MLSDSKATVQSFGASRKVSENGEKLAPLYGTDCKLNDLRMGMRPVVEPRVVAQAEGRGVSSDSH